MRGRRVSQALVGVASFCGGEADGEAKQEHAEQLHREWELWFGRLFAFDEWKIFRGLLPDRIYVH